MPDSSQLRYTKSHEWVAVADAVATIGITDHAQSQLGDVIFLELPEVGQKLNAGDRFGTIESVKAASDLYAPVGGTVTEVNAGLTTSPEQVNSDPLGAGWMIRLSQVSDGSELMDEAAYQAMIAG